MDYTVLMLTPENDDADFDRLLDALGSFTCKSTSTLIESVKPHKAELSIRTAVLSRSEILPVEKSVGRVCASPTVSCPPAVPIVISGERITERDVELFKHYGISTVCVVK